VTLVDTAGIRDSVDPIEQEGVARARRRAGSADLTLWLDDGAGGQIAGVDQLLDALAELAEERMSSREPALLTVERHRYAFQDARDALAATLGPDAAEWELIAEDLRRAAAAMDRIVGRIGAEEVLGEIFARLCVGK
jgi:tRNA modification GTPase